MRDLLRGMCRVGVLAICLQLIGCDTTTTNGGPAVNPNSGSQEDRTSGRTDEPNAYSGYIATYLDQGWNEEQRHRFYYLSQGSQLVPYSWFVCLQLPDSDELFISDRHMASLGCITQPPAERNPDGLPIGFVKDSNPSTIAMKAAFLGPDFDIDHYPKTEGDWLGLTCAACHTADLAYNGKIVRIDGGAAMTDIERFLSVLAESMRATVSDDAEYAGFVNRLRERDGPDADSAPSREEFESYTRVIERLVARNKAAHPYGLARLDAFGAILNEVTAGAVNIPENRRPSSAPVSYPFLWDTPHFDWVQWNSAAEIPIARNVGEVLGVFAHFELTDTPKAGYPSSARIDYLHELEVLLRGLKSPPWPEEVFGEIDQAKAAAGKELFAANCANCHKTRNEQGDFEMTPPNGAGNRYIKTTSIDFREIGTDSLMVVNFATRTAKPGILADAVAPDMARLEASGGLERLKQLRVALGMPAPDFSQEVPAGLLLAASVTGVSKRYFDEQFRNLDPEQIADIVLDLRGGRPLNENNPRPNGGIGYKARPLNGVWATAPFLHNGSVPNLYELLKPQEQRVQSFYVGSREFDPLRVGLSTKQVAGAFHFRTVTDDGTPIPGNSNQGHSGGDHTDFSDEQRWAIIEYLKTLE